MSLTAPPAVPADPPLTPSRADEDTFDERADLAWAWLFTPFWAFVSAFRTWYSTYAKPEMEALQADVGAKQAAAAVSAAAASTSAIAAASSANAALWVTGTNYPVPSAVVAGARVYSPSNQVVYADTVGGVSNTDPALDTSARWVLAAFPTAEAIGLPNVVPTIVVNGLLGISNVPLVVTRAGVKSYYDARGFLKYDDAGVLSKSHDPKTKSPIGYPIDYAATYLDVRSTDMAGGWATSNVTVTNNVALGLDGALSMAKVEATATATGSVTRQVTATATKQYYKIRVKKGSGAAVMNTFGVYNITTAADLIFITINYDTGVVTQIIGAGGTAKDLGAGIWELDIPCETGVAVGNVLQLYAGCSGGPITTGDYAYVTQPQISDRRAAPFFPTSGATATRPADILTISGTAFSNIWNPRAGTIFAKVTDLLGAGVGESRVIAEISDGSTNNRYTLYLSGGSLVFNVDSGGLNNASLVVAGVATLPGTTAVVAAWDSDAGTAILTATGHAMASAVISAAPVVDRLTIGGLAVQTGFELGGPLAVFTLSPVAHSAAECRALVNNA